MEPVECRYRGRLIGWLVTEYYGNLKYMKHEFRTELGVHRQWPDGKWAFTRT